MPGLCDGQLTPLGGRLGRRSHDTSRRLGEGCADVLGMSGAGISLMSGELPRGSVCSSNNVSSLIEDLQYSLGEGPGIDAFGLDRPVIETDLAVNGPGRWPVFSPPAIAAGARAVFGFPMGVGPIRMGALNLYRDRPGPLEDDQHADALVLATVAAQAVLSMQSDAPAGALGPELEAGGEFHLLVHQASGMVSVQRAVSVGEALVRLRARAFAGDRRLGDLARDVVDRRLRF